MDTDRVSVPKEKLMEYIRDAIPELGDVEIPTPNTWGCPAQDLPIPQFEKGEIVVWNDKFITRNHGARTHCGEGPFTVHFNDSYIVAFTKNASTKMSAQFPERERVVLKGLNGEVIIAHPGYFTRKERA